MFKFDSAFSVAGFPGMVYQHLKSKFKVIFLDSPGPLVTCSIIVPTICKNDKGLPHTLEHLVFCGSKSIPHRGYLDNLATRSLSSGTNAYTAEDHTSYLITTAGSEGMSNVFPVFMDHILNPNLTDSQFLSEIYHLDGDAKHQGVVFCEMASREFTESDIMDLGLRKLVFPDSTYSYECGGFTKDIQQLNLSEIKAYHHDHYRLDAMTAIIVGPVDPDTFLKNVVLQQGDHPSETEYVLLNSPCLKPITDVHSTIHFPSSDLETATIAYGWRGPSVDNINDYLVIELLCRYFSESSSSPLNQKFVEISDPIATDVDFSIRPYVETMIVCSFSGVPYLGEDSLSEESEFTDESEDSNSLNESSESIGESRGDHVDYFEPGYFNKLVVDSLEEAVNNFNIDRMKSTIQLYVRKMHEDLESNSHQALYELIVIDLLASSYSKPTPLGSRSKLFEICDELLMKDAAFWKKEATTWILTNQRVEVICLPDEEMASELDNQTSKDHQSRKSKLGKSGLDKLKTRLETALVDNQINIPKNILDSMPSIPDLSKLNHIEFTHSNHSPSTIHLKLDTHFSHIKFGLDISQIPKNLDPYLVLFQALLFESSVKQNSGILEYTQAVDKSQELFISYDASLGFGNDLYTIGWLSPYFIIQCTTNEYEKSCEWISEVLNNTLFSCDRVETTIKNLIGGMPEIKRDGSSMLSCVTSYIHGSEIEKSICIFRQEKFLKSVLDLLKNDSKGVLSDLECVRKSLLEGGIVFSQVSTSSEVKLDPFLKCFEDMVSKSDTSPFPIKKPLTTFKFGRAILVPIRGIQTSFMHVSIECEPSSEDIGAILVLSEIFSRIEGPLYTQIRGQGLAYGCSMYYSWWKSQLIFDCSEVSDAYECYQAFFKVLESFTFNSFELETAISCVLYRHIESRSTPSDQIHASLKSLFQYGKVDSELESRVKNVSRSDLDRVYQSWFLRFQDPKKRDIVITSPFGKTSKDLKRKFGSCKDPIDLKLTLLDSFK